MYFLLWLRRTFCERKLQTDTVPEGHLYPSYQKFEIYCQKQIMLCKY